MELFSTKNYNELKLLPFNRKINESRGDVPKSIRLYGQIDPVKVVKVNFYGKNELYIVDGQHRFHSLKLLNMEIFYVLISNNCKNEKDLVSFTAMYNSTSRQWSPANYVKAYCHINMDNYLFLDKKKKESGFSHTVVANIYNGILNHSNTKDLKSGSFKPTMKSFGNGVLKDLAILKRDVEFSGRMALGFGIFKLKNLNKIDLNLFKKNLILNQEILKKIGEEKNFANLFNEIYSM